MSKIIWKDIDSTTIKGLLICELPPITKPKMRVQETAIDGVDGSIIEELGYETYDKEIRIGLTYNYDIDEVIKYFTGEGNVVFSNEPDKYYKAKIIEQIDYTRLLRFKEAVVRFRVQPFKYEYQEKATILSEQEEQEISGTDIQLIDGKITELSIETTNEDVEIKVTGKNLFEPKLNVATSNGITCINNGDGTFTLNGTATNDTSFRLDQSTPNGNDNLKIYNGDYTLSCKELVSGVNFTLMQIDTWKSPLSTKVDRKSITTHIDNMEDMFMYVYVFNGTELNDLTIRPMLEKGTVATDFEAYKEKITTKDEILNLDLFYGINNISNSENANMIIHYVEPLNVINSGNYLSKPVITITGAGTIALIVNGYKLFNYTFPEGEDTVIIDSQKQDAYLGAVLKNRNMNGEFPILEIGKNTIAWEGTISSIKISSKSRWL